MTSLGKLTRLSSTVLMLAGMLAGTGAHAQAVPDTVKPPGGGNYGSTSFYDGFGRTTAGFTLLQYFTWEAINTIDSYNGKPPVVDLPNGPHDVFVAPRINAYVSLTQVSYTTNWHPFGGDGVGFSIAVPLVDLNFHEDPGSLAHLKANGFAVGDTVFGPIYQSRIYKDHGRPEFAWRFQLIILAPTGGFNRHSAINQGCGYWAINPYISTTWAPTPYVEFSTRFNYQYNFRTGNLALAPGFTNGQAGQIIYDNFDASYKITKKFELGVNGYFIDELTYDQTDGIVVAHSLENDVYVGPGFRYAFSPTSALNVNVYLPVEAHNESVGPKFNMQFIHRF